MRGSMANGATLSLKIDLAAFGEGLKTALRMGEVFGKSLNEALTGRVGIDTKKLDDELKKYQGQIDKLDNTKVEIDTAGAVREVRQLAGETESAAAKTKTSVTGIRDQFAMWGLAIRGAVEGARMVGSAIQGLIRPALEAEDAQEGLRASLRATGIYSEDLAQRIFQSSSALQELTRYEDDAITSGTALMQNIGRLGAEQLEPAQRAAIGLAAAFRIDIGTAFELVGKAAAGNTSTLGRYGIVLNEAGSAQDKFNELLEIGADKFGLAEEAARTGAGKIEQFKNTWGDMVETIGAIVIPAIAGVLSVLKPVVEWFGRLNEAAKATIVITPLLVAGWYALVTAGGAASIATGGLTVALGAAAAAVRTFLTAIGPVGWAILAAGAGISVLSAVLGKAKQDTDALAVSQTNAAAEIQDAQTQVSVAGEKFRLLSTRLLELKGATEQTAEEQAEMKGIIRQLNGEYSQYLGNINLEADGYDRVAESLRNASGALVQKKVAEIYGQKYGEQIDRIAKLQIQYKQAAADYQQFLAKIPAAAVDDNAMGFNPARYFSDLKDKSLPSAGYTKTEADYYRIGKELTAARSELDKFAEAYREAMLGVGEMDFGGGGGGGGGGNSGDNSETPASRYARLMEELQRQTRTATEQMEAEWARYNAEILAVTGSDSAERAAAMDELAKWRTKREGEIAADAAAEQKRLDDEREQEERERAERMKEWLDKIAADSAAYYDKMKWQDEGYYNWRKQSIELEIAKMTGISAEQRDVLLKARIDELDKEKAAWERLPLDAILQKYKDWKSEMADTREVGVAQWAAIRDGLVAIRDELQAFAGDPEVDKVLELLAGEIDVANLNAGKKTNNWFWSLLGFGDSEADKAQITRIQNTLGTISGMIEDVVNGAINLEEQRKQKELERIDEVAARQKWSDKRVAAEKEKVEREYAEKEKGYRRIQQIMSITQAGINTAEGVTKAYALGGPLGFASAGLIAALGAAQIAFIAQQEFGSGGYTGDGQRDEVAGTVHRGEIVMEAPLVKRNFRPLMALRQLMQKGWDLTDLVPALSLNYLAVPRPAAQIAFSGGGYVGGDDGVADEIRGLRRDIKGLQLVGKLNMSRMELAMEFERASRELRGT